MITINPFNKLLRRLDCADLKPMKRAKNGLNNMCINENKCTDKIMANKNDMNQIPKMTDMG